MATTPASDLDEQRTALRAKFDAPEPARSRYFRTAQLAELIGSLDQLTDVADLMQASRVH